MRIARLFPFLLFSLSIGLRAQKVTTVFVDSVTIKINSEIIYSHYETYLKFLPSDKSGILKLFDDGTHKLQLEFPSYAYGDYSYLRTPDVKFYRNEVLQALATEALPIGFSERYCSGVNDDRYKISSIIKGPNESTTEILLRLRYFGFAPKDTSNYPYNYRKGEWHGFFSGVKEIIINYELDKKNGRGKVIYNDGTIYNTNFVDGFVDDYGYGTFENRKNSKYIIPNIVSISCDDNFNSLYLKKGRIKKKAERNDKLSVCFVKKGIRTDSIEYNVQGDLVTVKNDTMVIHSDALEVHDFYKKNTDSLHFYYKDIANGFQKVPMSDITQIKKVRSVLQGSVISLTVLSVISAIVVSPLISIQKHGFNTNRFLKVSGVSMGVAGLSVSVGVIFGSKKFMIAPVKGKKTVWQMNPDYD